MIHLFENKLTLVLLFFCLPLLFLPKINLLEFSTETAGLRLDDFILSALGILLIMTHAISHQKLYKIEGIVLLLIGFSLFSFVANHFLVSAQILFIKAKIFYVVRLLEYFLFFYIGGLASKYLHTITLIRLFFLWNLILMLLQKTHLLGGFTTEGYQEDVSDRVQGIASFPSEMGSVLNLLFCYMIYHEAPSRFISLISSPLIRTLFRQLYPYGMFCLFGALIIFTGNRISILALFICFVCRLKQGFQWRSLSSYFLFVLLIPLLAIGIGLLVKQTASVYERSADLFSLRNLELAKTVWEKVDLTQDPLEHETPSSKDYDMSWWIRIHKWTFILKAYLSNPLCYLQGLGPGVASSALDGGLLRIVTEYGIVGTLLFWYFFSCLSRINQQTKWMMIVFVINMIFFDAYLAYKTMSLLLLACGDAFERSRLNFERRCCINNH
jgi:hypothetical protein